MFDMRYQEHGIKHRLTKVKHPRANNQVVRMNRTIKKTTVERFHYDSHAYFEQHMTEVIKAHNYATHLKTRRDLTPYKFICENWDNQPERFTNDPTHQMLGLNRPVVERVDQCAKRRITAET